MKLFMIIISQLLFHFTKCQPHKLYEHIEQHQPFFSTKTLYSFVSAKNLPSKPINCSVLQLWMLARHGVRNPQYHVIERILKLDEYQNVDPEKSGMPKSDIDELKTWKFGMTVDDAGLLNSQGIEDMKQLAIRLQTLYKEIFNVKYSCENFSVITSPKQRCLDSARTFLNEAFHMDIDEKDMIQMEIEDNRFNLFKRVKINYTKEHINAFVKGTLMKKVLKNVTNILGLNELLTFGTVEAMYEACRDQKASNIKLNSPWCAVFSAEDFEIFEYYNDLKYYYLNGYGRASNEQLSREILGDLKDHFRAKSQNEPGPLGVLYFGHSSNVISVIVGLGFARDTTPLTDGNFEKMRDRKWRTSFIDPYAANIIAVLYKCEEEMNVTFFINDVPMYVEKYKCTLCPWKSIEKMLGQIDEDE